MSTNVRRPYTVEESLTRAIAEANAWQTLHIKATEQIEELYEGLAIQAQEIARLIVISRECQAHLDLLMDQTTEYEKQHDQATDH